MKTVCVALQQFCEMDARPRRMLEENGFQVQENHLKRRLTSTEMPGFLKEADAVIAGVEPYDERLLRQMPKLRLISRCGAGTDSIDEDAARALRIAVRATPEVVVEPVAQLTVAMILALARNFPGHLSDFRQGFWTKRAGHLLSEWTVGLVGFGRIGRRVGDYLRPFGVRIVVFDPRMDPGTSFEGVTIGDFEMLLKEADLVSLHAGRRKEEGPLMRAHEFSLMKRGSFLVNTARGYLVEEAALLAALQRGHLAGAALDVFEEEPYTGPLMKLPQVICTPHVATLTKSSRAAMELEAAQNVVTFFNGK